MKGKAYIMCAVGLCLLAATVNLLGGCRNRAAEAATTTTAALKEEPLASTEHDSSFTYSLYKSYCVIAAYNGGGATVAVPSVYGGLPVMGIGDGAFARNTVVTRVMLPASVVDIAQDAFRGCTALQSVTMPGVRAIGIDAFRESGLCELTLPACLENLGHYAFSGTHITSLELNCKIPITGEYAFAYCRDLTTVTVGGSVRQISSHMFYGCTSLCTVTAGDAVCKVGDYAFAACPALTGVTLPAALNDIGDGIFYDSPGALVRAPEQSAAYNRCRALGLPLA